MSYTRYGPGAAPGDTGWDAWAGDYAALGATNAVYALGKELLHERLRALAPPPQGRAGWALDFHCGAGDDLARLLAAGWHVAGCDGSGGMLRAAAARCAVDLDAGRLELWHGRAETLESGAFGARRFDLVFSTTGGFAYLDDDEFVRVHRVLAGMLAPAGRMVVAHLTPGCLAETLYHLAHLRVGRAVRRWRGRVAVTVRGEPLAMRLRGPRRLRRLLADVVRIERVSPLLVFTPPFQTGFAPGPRAVAALRGLERRAAWDPLAAVADQAVVVARARSSSANSSR